MRTKFEVNHSQFWKHSHYIAWFFHFEEPWSGIKQEIFCCKWNVEILVWQVSSASQSTELLVQQAEISTAGWGSLWERSPVGSWFCKSLFRDVTGTVPENVRTCGFKRNSSNLDRAPKMRDSVLLNSWDSFLWPCPQSPQKLAWSTPQ